MIVTYELYFDSNYLCHRLQESSVRTLPSACQNEVCKRQWVQEREEYCRYTSVPNQRPCAWRC